MPPQEHFTAGLLETLASSRRQLTEYVERKKADVDAQVLQYNEALGQEEERIQTQKEALKAIQSERGLSSPEGMAQRREQLHTKRTHLEERVRNLQEEARKQQLTVEGMSCRQ